MSEDFLKNPLSLFDIRGKTAIVTGASGAFGSLASKVLAGAGANVVLAAGNAAELEKVAGECQALGGKADFDWRPEGLLCMLSVPLTPMTAAQERASLRERVGTGL